MKILLIALLPLLVLGCSQSANQTEESKKLTTECTDTRDGGKFIFKNSTVKNAMAGSFGADSCVDVTDTTGKERHLCASMEIYLKCVNI